MPQGAIEKWRRERYPAIARQAKEENGDIFFWDESGFRADAVHGKTWALRGQTPVVQRPGQRQSVSAASAVNAKGAFWFCTYEGALNAELRPIIQAMPNLYGIRDVLWELPWHIQAAVLPCGGPCIVRQPKVRRCWSRCSFFVGKREAAGQ